MFYNPLSKLFNQQALLLVFTLSLAACGGSSPSPTDTTSSPTDTTSSPTNTAPVASDASVSLLPGATITGTLEANDADGDSLILSIVTQPSDGTLTLEDSSTGAYTYVNNGSANSDSFTFKANDGELDSSNATVSITTIAPNAPASGLNAVAGDQINTLTWDAVNGADSYNVYRSLNTGDGTSGTQIATGINSPYYDKGLTNGTTYYYVVTSVNTVGESTASAEVIAAPVDILISSLTIPDTNLKTCIDNTAATYVHEVTSLNCGSQSITNVSGLEALTSMTFVTLFNNSISDVSPLANLVSVNNLNLSVNNISDVSALADLTILTELYLNNNTIVDVGPLAGLVDLVYLDLRNNSIGGQGVGNVDQLSGLTNLTNSFGVKLGGNIGMSCSELASLISTLGSPPVDTDGTPANPDTATDGLNCTNP